MKKNSIKSNNKLLLNFINELKADCRQFGVDKKIYVYFDRQTKNIVDYDLEKNKIKYVDEIEGESNVFALLANFIYFAYLDSGYIISPSQAVIKTCRHIKDMTQAEFAEFTNNSANSIDQWERGIRNPKYDALQRIASSCNIPTEIFFDTLSNVVICPL